MRTVVIGCYVALLMLVSLWVSWQALSRVDYGFPWFYDAAGIGAAVHKYGPQNRYKQHFEVTTRVEHERLFAEIAKAINNGGEGLAAIEYRRADGRPIDKLLREPEVLHLQDVANLLDRLRVAAYVSGVGALLLLGVAAARRWQLPGLWSLIVGALATTAALGVAVALYGAEKLFYQWHTAVFPEGHEWFFYYQDSLMTTLMRAPVIFGYIGALLVVIALCVFLLGLWVSRALLRRASVR